MGIPEAPAPLPAFEPLGYSWTWIAIWLCAAITGAAFWLYAHRGRTQPAQAVDHLQAVGAALLSVPIWQAIWGFINSIPALVDSGSVLLPISRYGLSGLYARGLMRDFGYLAVGFALWTAHKGWPRSVRDLATRLRDEGLALRGRESWSAWMGFALFPVLLAVTYLFNYIVTNQIPGLVNGDESSVWANMTIYHSLIISAMAAFTEELAYRGVLMVALAKGLQRIGVGRPAAAWSAVVVQAVIFGLAHGGYGTFFHVLAPLFFGLIAGAVAYRFGIWAAIMLHFLIDIFAFGAEASNNASWWLDVLVWLLFANVVATLGTAGYWVWRKWTARSVPA